MSLRDKFKNSNRFDIDAIRRSVSDRKTKAVSDMGDLVKRFVSGVEDERAKDPAAGERPNNRSSRDRKKVKNGAAIDSIVKYVLKNLSEYGENMRLWDEKEVALSDEQVKFVDEQTRPMLSMNLFNELLFDDRQRHSKKVVDKIRLSNSTFTPFDKNGKPKERIVEPKDPRGSLLISASVQRINKFVNVLMNFYLNFINGSEWVDKYSSLSPDDQRLSKLKKTYTENRINVIQNALKSFYMRWCDDFCSFMDTVYTNVAKPTNNTLGALRNTFSEVEKKLNSASTTNEKIYGNAIPNIVNQRLKSMLEASSAIKTNIGGKDQSFADIVEGGGYFVGIDAWEEIKRKVVVLYKKLNKLRTNSILQTYFDVVGLDVNFGKMALDLENVIKTVENCISQEVDVESKMNKFGTIDEKEDEKLYNLPESVVEKSINAIVKYSNEKWKRDVKFDADVFNNIDPGTIIFVDKDTIAGRIPTVDGYLNETIGRGAQLQVDDLKKEITKYDISDFSNRKCMVLLWAILKSCCNVYTKQTSSKSTHKQFVHFSVEYKPKNLNQWVFSYPAMYYFIDFLSGIYSGISTSDTIRVEYYDEAETEAEKQRKYNKSHVILNGGNIKFILISLYNNDFGRFVRKINDFIENRYYHSGMWIGGNMGKSAIPPPEPPPLA